VENDENEMAHMSFVGLPSPGAADMVISLIIFHQEQVPGFDYLVYALPFATLGVGVLMVSRVRYPHIVNVYLRGKQPFGYLIRVLLFLGLVWWNIQVALVLIFGYFVMGNFAKWLYAKMVAKPGRLQLPGQAPSGEAAPGSVLPP